MGLFSVFHADIFYSDLMNLLNYGILLSGDITLWECVDPILWTMGLVMVG